MRRRDVLAWLVGVAVLWPLASKAQDARKVYRVGLLWDSHAMFPKAIEALRTVGRSESLIRAAMDGGALRADWRARRTTGPIQGGCHRCAKPIYTGAAKRATSTRLGP